MLIAEIKQLRSMFGVEGRRRMPSRGIPHMFDLRYASVINAGLVEPVYDVLRNLPWITITSAKDVSLLISRARINLRADDTAVERAAQKQGADIVKWQHDLFREQVRAKLGIELNYLLPALATIRNDSVDTLYQNFVGENVALIKTIPQNALADVEKTISRAYADGMRNRDLGALIEKRYQISRNEAMRIAVDQTGKLNGRVAMEQHRAIGIGSFYWRTMRDKAVRPTHKELEGRVFFYPDPPRQPGQEVCCRCYPEPNFDNIMAMM